MNTHNMFNRTIQGNSTVGGYGQASNHDKTERLGTFRVGDYQTDKVPSSLEGAVEQFKRDNGSNGGVPMAISCRLETLHLTPL